MSKVIKCKKSSKEISLKSIYNLVINIQKDSNDFKISTNKRFDILEKDNKEIKQRLTNIENDVGQLKSLPTISKKLKHNRFFTKLSRNYKKNSPIFSIKNIH